MRHGVARNPPGNSIAAGVGDARFPCLESMFRNALLSQSSLVAPLLVKLAIGEAGQSALDLTVVEK